MARSRTSCGLLPKEIGPTAAGRNEWNVEEFDPFVPMFASCDGLVWTEYQ